MKNWFLLVLFAGIGISIQAQKAEPIISMTKAQRSGEFYKTQTSAWKTIAESKKTDGNAWMNYYDAARYSNMFNKEEDNDLKKIVATVNKNLPNSFEANYLNFSLNPWEKESVPLLKKAYSIAPDNPRTYQALINHFIIEQDETKTNEICTKYFESSENSPGLLAWNHNAMVNLAPNAILLTEGDNDTYHAWILQGARDFRKDILVLNSNLIMAEIYRNMIFSKLNIPELSTDVEEREWLAYRQTIIDHIMKHSDRPIYFGIGTRHEMREKYEDKLSLIGLSFKYSAAEFDHMAVLKKSYEQDFHLDYMKFPMTNDPHQVEINRYSRSYLPSLFKLYKFYKKNDELSKAKSLEEFILLIGSKCNTLEETKKTLAKY